MSTSPKSAVPPAAPDDWNRVVATLDATLQHALPTGEADSRALAAAIADATQRIQEEGATPLLADELRQLCQRADRVLQHRHHLVEQLRELCRELASTLAELADDDSWAKGQCEAMRLKMDEGLNARGVKAASHLLHTLRERQIESELRRLSEEVSIDRLTQVANRRGLLEAFEAEHARMERTGSILCVGLLDIDDFKRFNDEWGHAVGDEALKSLAAVVSKTLRPTDMTARCGGEEFVVLLPDTSAEEGQMILTRLQRSLSGGLFMHGERQVHVTFSAGVTASRPGERIEEALERADQALYEAKRTGKNKTCVN